MGGFIYPPLLNPKGLVIIEIGGKTIILMAVVSPRATVDGLEIRRSPLDMGNVPIFLQGFTCLNGCRISGINSIEP